MNKKFATVGLLAGLTAGTGAGFIMQQSGFAGASDSVSVVEPDDSATDPALDADRPAPGTRLGELLAPLVADGTLTQAQLDAVVQTLVDAGPMRGPGGGRGPGHHHRGEHLATAATALGITTEELRSQLIDGSTIADVAAAQGVELQTVIDALVAEAKSHLDEKVAAGRLTQEQADARLTEITSRITDMVNGIRPAGAPSGDADTAG